MARNSELDKQATMHIYSTYTAKGMKPEYDELPMTFAQALLQMKDAAEDYRRGGYKVTVIKTYGSGLAECPMWFIASKRTHYGNECHRYQIAREK